MTLAAHNAIPDPVAAPASRDRVLGREKGRLGQRRDDGATMVEFAFVGVLLFLLLFGIVAYGILLSVKNSVTQAANEGGHASVSVFIRQDVPLDGLDGAQIALLKQQQRDAAEAGAITRMRERLAYLENDLDGPIETRCTDAASCPPVADPAITYLARVHDCAVTDEERIVDFADATVNTITDDEDCLFAKVVYNHSDYRVLPALPLIDLLLPDTVSDRADVALT